MLSLATPAGAERCGDGVEVTDAGASPSMDCGRVVARDGGGILSDTESGPRLVDGSLGVCELPTCNSSSAPF